MLARERAQKRTLSMMVIAATAACVSMLAGTAAAGAKSLPKRCPTVSAIALVARTRLTTRKDFSRDGEVLCGYSNAKTHVTFQFDVAPVAHAGAAAFRTTIINEAKADKATPKRISGLGTVAYTFMIRNAKANPDHLDTTNVSVLVGASELVLAAPLPSKDVLAVAKQYA